MNFIRIPDKSIYRIEYILNLTFLNISFIITLIRPELYTSSDYKTQIIIISGQGVISLK
jgi:hypothetical protein